MARRHQRCTPGQCCRWSRPNSCKQAEGGVLTPEATKDLRAATDFALMATKRAAQSVGKAMGFMVVLQRHLWLNLADLKDADRKVLLNAPISPSGLFGDAVETITERLLRLKSARKRWVTWCLDAPPSNRLLDPDLRQRMALPSGEIFPGLPRLGLLLLLLDRSQTSGGRCGAPAGSAKVSGEARDATLARPRLLSRLPDDRREGGERESSPAPKRPKFSCQMCVLSVHSIKMHTFSQKELSPPHSINAVPLAPPQCSAGPHPTQVIAAHPTTEQLKPLRQFISAGRLFRESRVGYSTW